ncbi:MAG: phosphomannomutase/phosphoglucomutase [Planctomycetota bacterium]|nr:phosphomannomutase/phosphoglucomutase [Planctomycetota bacterium]MDG2144797.1 phosphomannomutase/phosphoglucomutase [Planctomycetota bacterium]
MGIFKAYDIRGLYPSQIDEDTCYRVGYHLAQLLEAKRLVVGQDMRVHSPGLADAVSRGMRDAGCDVIRLGLASTPMAYHAIATLECDGGLCVTASHNPGEYNGMKLCRAGAKPISAANGILDLERLCAGDAPIPVGKLGVEDQVDLLENYSDHVASFSRIDKPVKVAIDVANGMAGNALGRVLSRIPNIEASIMLEDMDGNFPVHEANPLIEENLDGLRELVKRTGSRIGIAFDGDADRCCFVDETGATISADLMTGLLAPGFVTTPDTPIVYDLRSSWAVKEEITKAGGRPIRDRVGHSFIKATMRDNGAVFGGELSGHFYFQANHTCDSGMIAMVTVLNFLSLAENSDKPVSALLADLRRYHSTGEINFRVEDKDAAIASLKEKYADGKQDELDGITVEFGDLSDPDWWWFNVRCSNTEPLLRLNLEASTAAERDSRRDELVALLGTPE